MSATQRAGRRDRWFYLAPLALFALLVALLHDGLDRDPSRLPSAYLAKPLPSFSAPLLEGGGEFATGELKGRVWLLNIWASWCRPCLLEHPQISWLAAQKLSVVGLNYKDERAAALAWLEEHGDPFALTAVDANGRIGIELGVYGVPETFLIGADGHLLYKHVGPLTRADAEALLERAQAAQGAQAGP